MITNIETKRVEAKKAWPKLISYDYEGKPNKLFIYDSELYAKILSDLLGSQAKRKTVIYKTKVKYVKDRRC